MKSLEKNKHSFPTLIITIALVVFCVLWTLPTVGILVTSFRTPDAASSTGWWKAFSNFKDFTLDNYNQVLFGQRFSVGNATGTSSVRGATMLSAFLSSITVTLPSVIIPILIAAAAAYGFAWLSFKGRNVMFAIIIALLVVPLQISLIPILRDYTKIGLNGSYLGIWLAHTGFGLPLATYMMYNYISSLPRSILESAFIDGSSHFTTFVRLILPLSAPAIASFAIFQFIWVWNDMLVALVFLSGAGQKVQVVTVRLMNMAGTRGTDWHLLTAGAFVSMILPLCVFLGLQKFFVKGLLAGSVKG
ncbi:MAG: carbohydrate ABC transporter permease [Treponema sp.]|uniref:carbohydrate ABC transporter permease n=1 Tax=Treponema sp. TaxID=166 RepID=UPI0025D48516|nr:carbohydrate ABC transporter permease [Treponema sp.]MBQ9622877.1 carbohydrate ABC transporter permease [Treponema sp.]MBR0099395.1 carbohydrate ABC transporter permease [Treponema sp.]MBR0495301.1 carbohydrate ABC transporter permease [Treponema sp.]